MHDQPLSGMHKFPPHEQHLYGAEKGDIKTALYLIDRIGRNSSEDPRGDAAKAAELIRLGFSIEPDYGPPQKIMEAALAITAWADSRNLKDWQVAGIGPVDVRIQEPIGWTQKSNLEDDGHGHSFSVISSEPASDTTELYAPVFAKPVNARTIESAAKEECALACVAEAQRSASRGSYPIAGALMRMAELFRRSQ